MNVAPASTSDPRAARRTSCLGTFLLVLVLWSFSVVALAAYLVTRSAIVRQVRVAWWAVFLAAAALLAVEVAIFEATGGGLADLLRLHVHPWWLLLHGYGIGSPLTWPLTVVACQAPLGLPTGAMAAPSGVSRRAAGRRGRTERLQPTPSPDRQGPRLPPGHPGHHRYHEPTNPAPPQRWASPIPAATCIPGCANAAGSPRWSS